jgi:uncharacterized membrane protein YdjX (TVP38/TMEM64 family)
MSIDQTVIIFGVIVGVCTFFVGMGLGIIIGYVIGRRERVDIKKLKRSDHYHYERKRPKS